MEAFTIYPLEGTTAIASPPGMETPILLPVMRRVSWFTKARHVRQEERDEGEPVVVVVLGVLVIIDE